MNMYTFACFLNFSAMYTYRKVAVNFIPYSLYMILKYDCIDVIHITRKKKDSPVLL